MSGHGLEPPSGTVDLEEGILGVLGKAMRRLHEVLIFLSALALIAASLILCYSVAARYIWHMATYWQDEAAVFLLVGATFISAGFVQQQRGHIGIGAIVSILPAGVNRVRAILVDAATLAFCGFFALKSWRLFEEAWTDGQVTSSTWGPPLWIPYGIMAAGMSILCLQLLLQLAAGLSGKVRP